MKEYEYILFDLDGTVINSAQGVTNSVKYALEKLEYDVPDYNSLCRFIGPPLTEGFMTFCGFSHKKAEKALSLYREYYNDKGIFECYLYPGIAELLRQLHKSGKKTVLATSKPEEYAKRILKHFGIDKYFFFIGGASFDESRSSKEAVMAYIIDSINLKDVKKAVMVGDRHHDVYGAHKFGIECIGVLYGFGGREELEGAGAEYIAADTNELKDLL